MLFRRVHFVLEIGLTPAVALVRQANRMKPGQGRFGISRTSPDFVSLSVQRRPSFTASAARGSDKEVYLYE